MIYEPFFANSPQCYKAALLEHAATQFEHAYPPVAARHKMQVDSFLADVRALEATNVPSVDCVIEPAPVGYAVGAPVWFQHGTPGRIAWTDGTLYKVDYGMLTCGETRFMRYRLCTAAELDRWQARALSRVQPVLKATG